MSSSGDGVHRCPLAYLLQGRHRPVAKGAGDEDGLKAEVCCCCPPLRYRASELRELVMTGGGMVPEQYRGIRADKHVQPQDSQKPPRSPDIDRAAPSSQSRACTCTLSAAEQCFGLAPPGPASCLKERPLLEHSCSSAKCNTTVHLVQQPTHPSLVQPELPEGSQPQPKPAPSKEKQ